MKKGLLAVVVLHFCSSNVGGPHELLGIWVITFEVIGYKCWVTLIVVRILWQVSYHILLWEVRWRRDYILIVVRILWEVSYHILLWEPWEPLILRRFWLFHNIFAHFLFHLFYGFAFSTILCSFINVFADFTFFLI